MATLCSLTRHYTPCDSRIDQLLEVEPPAVPCAPFGCNWLCVLHLFLERTASDGNSEVLRGICCVRLEQNGNYLHPNCESSTIRIYTHTPHHTGNSVAANANPGPGWCTGHLCATLWGIAFYACTIEFVRKRRTFRRTGAVCYRSNSISKQVARVLYNPYSSQEGRLFVRYLYIIKTNDPRWHGRISFNRKVFPWTPNTTLPFVTRTTGQLSQPNILNIWQRNKTRSSTKHTLRLWLNYQS